MNYDVIKLKAGDLDYIYKVIVKDAKKLYMYDVMDNIPLPRIAFEFDINGRKATEYYDFDADTRVLKIKWDYVGGERPISFLVETRADSMGRLAFINPDFDSMDMPDDIRKILTSSYSDDLVEDIPTWMGFCGRFINVNRFIKEYTPEVVCNTTIRHTEQGGKSPRGKKKSSKPNKVKTYKVYRFKEDLERVVKEHRHNTVTCPAWGVRGHYRHYKSGKVVWVRACVKGKEKDKYKGKEYEIYDNNIHRNA